MKLDLKLLPVMVLALAASASGQSTQSSTTSTGQTTQNTQPSQSQTQSLADRARKTKAQSQSGAKPRVFNQDNLAAATSGKTHSSKHGKPKRSGLRKTS